MNSRHCHARSRTSCFPEPACEDAPCQAPQAVQHRHLPPPATYPHPPGSYILEPSLAMPGFPDVDHRHIHPLVAQKLFLDAFFSRRARRYSGQPRSWTHRPRRRNLRAWSSRTQGTQKRHIARERRRSMRARLRRSARPKSPTVRPWSRRRRGVTLNRSERNPGRENIVRVNAASESATNARLRRSPKA